MTEIMGVALTGNMGVRPTQFTALPFKIFYNHAFHKDFACEGCVSGGLLIVKNLTTVFLLYSFLKEVI
ncbi:MAG: hypothetical protein ABIK92_12680 [Pseudomonadota bacterium]